MQNEEEKALFDKYCGNNMKEIRKICYPLIQKSNIPMSEHDDIYSDAQKVVMESVKSYDKNKKCSFNTYFIGNMKRSFKEWSRDGHRWKRCNLVTDENVKLKRDENGNPIVIQNISFDADTEDGISLAEKIPYVENNSDDEELSPQMKDYLNGLSKVQRKILFFLSDGYTKDEIISMLKIDNFLYNDSMMAIKNEKNKRRIQMLVRR